MDKRDVDGRCTVMTSAAADRAKQVAAAIVTQMCYTDPMWDGGAAESAQDLMVPIIQKALEAQQTDDTLSRKEWWGLHLQCVRCGEDVVKLYTGEGVKNWVALCVPCWGKVQNKILASMPKLDSAKAEGKE